MMKTTLPTRLSGTTKGRARLATWALTAALCSHAVNWAAADVIAWDSGLLNGAIPDSSPAGWQDTHTFSGLSFSTITDVKVHLNISGGYNGDYYAFLQHGDHISVLLNRPGATAGNSFGYGDSGLHLWLADSAVRGDIHLYQNNVDYLTALAGGNSTWFQPDGRNQDPRTVTSSTARSSLLNQFTGLDPNGDWTLFIADMSGGESGRVLGWGLEITGSLTAVPEPSHFITMGFGLAAGAVAFFCRRRKPGQS
jgi:subtilisin-like proprotein convertase family protein